MTELVAPPDVGPTEGGAAILSCIVCGGHRSSRSKSGRCHKCAMRARAPAPRFCKCGKRLNRQTKSGMCLPCLRVTPEFQAKRLAAVRKAFENPEHRAKMAKVVARNHAKARLRPEFAQWLHEHGKHLQTILHSPEVRAKQRTPEHRAKMGKAVSDARLSWCPPELRAEYRSLIKSKRMLMSEARPIIEAKAQELRAIRHPCFEDVLHFMRRLTAVLRLDNGNYRVGLAELTPGQLLKRAESKGYSFERMAA